MLTTNDVQLVCNNKQLILEANAAAYLMFGKGIVGNSINEYCSINKVGKLIDNAFIPVTFGFNNIHIKGLIGKIDDKLIYQFKGTLSEEDNRYKLLSEVSIEAIAMTHNKTIIDCNQQFVDLYGYDSIEEVIGLTIDDFVEPEHRSFVDGLLEKDEIHKVEITNKKKDGTPVIIESKGIYMNYHGKRVRVSVMYDITDRKHIEKKLEEREKSMQTLLSHLPGMAYRTLVKKKLCMQYVSEGCKELTGYTPEEIIAGTSITYQDLVPSDFRKNRFEQLSSLKNAQYSFEYHIITKKGLTKWLWERGEIVYENNKAYAAEGFISDITKRKNYEKQLEESNEQFKNLVEKSPDGIFLHQYGLIQYVNPKAWSLVDVANNEEILGEDFAGLFVKYCPPAFKQKIIKTFEEKGLEYFEITYQTKAGKLLELGLNSIETWYGGSKVIQTTVTDITIEKRLDQEKVRLKVTQELNKVLTEENKKHLETQKKLIASEEFSQSIINSSLDMIIAIDNNGIITNFNKSAEKTFGYKASEVTGRHINLMYDSKFDFINVRNGLKDNEEFYGEVVNKNKKGNSFTTLLSASLIKNADGEIIGSMGISRDITKIKEVEHELKASEGKYRDLLENISEYIISIDVEGNFLFVNTSFKKAMGYSDQDFRTKKISEMLSEDMVDISQSTIQKIIEGKLPNPITTSFITKSGKKIILEGNTTVKYKHYKAESIRGFFRDVTENLEVEKFVKSQSAKMKSIFDSATNVLMWTLNESHQITSMNEKFKETIRKYCEIDIKIGSVFYQELGPNIQKGYYQELMFNKFVRAYSGHSEQFEVCMVDTYNEPVWFEVFINPIVLDDADEITEVSCMAYLINDKKEAAEKIEQALIEKDVLLKEVHHRVKNNLQVISSILNLQSSLVEDEKTLAILRESQSRIRTMSFIHESLYRTKDFSEIDFTEYLTNLSKNLVSSYSVSSKVKLTLELDNVHLSLDQAIPCGLIVNEIVTNSLKYAFKDIKNAEIFVKIHENEETIQLIIGDNGIGLPDDYLAHASQTLGVQLIEALTDQIDGEMKIENKAGTKYLLTFRKQN
jgi:PAS domain S-box-containing protein